MKNTLNLQSKVTEYISRDVYDTSYEYTIGVPNDRSEEAEVACIDLGTINNKEITSVLTAVETLLNTLEATNRDNKQGLHYFTMLVGESRISINLLELYIKIVFRHVNVSKIKLHFSTTKHKVKCTIK